MLHVKLCLMHGVCLHNYTLNESWVNFKNIDCVGRALQHNRLMNLYELLNIFTYFHIHCQPSKFAMSLKIRSQQEQVKVDNIKNIPQMCLCVVDSSNVLFWCYLILFIHLFIHSFIHIYILFFFFFLGGGGGGSFHMALDPKTLAALFYALPSNSRKLLLRIHLKSFVNMDYVNKQQRATRLHRTTL